MTFVEAARRLGVHETAVTRVREHREGHVVSLRDGREMLVSATVARTYIPAVDDVVGEKGPETLRTGKKGATVKAVKGRSGGTAA